MADNFDRAMVDIETLGTKPGCVIISIGAVRFTIDDGVTDELFVSVDAESCETHGLEIDAQTLQWWLDQSTTAQQQLFGGEELERALRDLRSFVAGCEETWANSPSFDLEILADAYDRVGISTPWSFWEERDYRTCRAVLEWPEKEQTGTAHNALDDARHQAESLIKALKEAER